MSPHGAGHTLGVQGFNYPDEGQQGPAVAQEGPGGPRPRVAVLTTPLPLLARAGAAVAPGQAATKQWKEEETAASQFSKFLFPRGPALPTPNAPGSVYARAQAPCARHGVLFAMSYEQRESEN